MEIVTYKESVSLFFFFSVYSCSELLFSCCVLVLNNRFCNSSRDNGKGCSVTLLWNIPQPTVCFLCLFCGCYYWSCILPGFGNCVVVILPNYDIQ